MSESPNEYECDDCGWLYRPAKHGGKEIEDQEDGWGCPKCQAGPDHFAIVVPEDLSNDDEDEVATVDASSGEFAVKSDRADPTIEVLHKRWKKGRLDTQPDFQRYEVWTPQKRSRLVESVLLGLPIPLFYFAEEADAQKVVIDGQQRLTSLFRYIDGEYALKGLGPLKELDGEKFADLGDRQQEMINETTITTITILKESDAEVRFHLFERLNEGATRLNDQELRNSVYRGDYNDWLKDTVSNHPDFRTASGLKKPHKRMVDVELVLRFMAFYHQTYLKHPDKKTKEFLNSEMELGPARRGTANKKAFEDFKKAVAGCVTVWGAHAFRRFVPGDEDSANGKWEPRINRALMDVQLHSFAGKSKQSVVKNRDALYEASIELLSAPVFADLVSHTISEKKRIKERFELWDKMVEEVIGSDPKNSRFFARKVKESLYAADQSCAGCSQKISTIDDAHVDHIKPWSKGGKTTETNAQLMHRFCNLEKGSGV